MGRKLLCVVVLLMIPAVLQAEEDAQRRAKALFKEGSMHYKVAEFELALEKYKQAFKLHSHPAIIFNLAQAHRQLGNHKKALFFYKLYLSEWGQQNAAPPNQDEVLSHIEKISAELEQRGREERSRKAAAEKDARAREASAKPEPGTTPRTGIKLNGVPSGARILVDGLPRGEGPQAEMMELKPGRHRIVVSKEGAAPWVVELEFPVGQVLSRDVVLGLPGTDWGTVWLSTGVVSAAVFAGSLAVGIAYNMKYNDPDLPEDDWDSTHNISIAGYATAGAFAALSGVSWIMYYRAMASRPEVAIIQSPVFGASPLDGGFVLAGALRF